MKFHSRRDGNFSDITRHYLTTQILLQLKYCAKLCSFQNSEKVIAERTEKANVSILLVYTHVMSRWLKFHDYPVYEVQKVVMKLKLFILGFCSRN